MDHGDRMEKTKELGDKVANEIILRLSHIKGEGLRERIDLVLKLAQLMKIMGELDDAGWSREEESV